jgi:PPOX class probable F420-dependent enzyme
MEELPPWARRMLEEARVGHLGFIDDALQPRVQPVTYAVHGGALWSAVDDKPKRAGGERLARVRFLRQRPQAALTVGHYDEDWTALAWVQVLGDVSVVAVEDGRDALAALVTKYEQYRAKAPGGPLLRLQPDRTLWWRS